MSNRALPHDGDERRIFIVGLRRMSDQCVPPALTPECPFSEYTAEGPVCAEQCMDLLAVHGGSSTPDVPGHTLGPGLAAVLRPAPRPRRAPASEVRPFDAARIRLLDQDRPTELKSTTSLMRDLRDHMTSPPTFATDPRERSYGLRAAFDELVSRGVDAELLVRCGLAHAVSAALGVSLILEQIVATSSVDGDGTGGGDASRRGLPDPDPRWRALFEEALTRDSGAPDNELEYYLTGAFGQRVQSWMATAPMEEVLAWAAPDVAAFFSYPRPEWTLDESARAIWLVDRFTETYLEQWRHDALAMEWAWLHGEQIGCCTPDVMRERPTAADEVARVLATYDVARWRARTRQGAERSFSAQDFTHAAADNLAAGRYEAAAAIFAAVVRLAPDSAEANNNYGFCVLPTDAPEALEHLNRAAALAEPGRLELTNAVNRVLALHLLGRDDEALAMAEAALSQPLLRSPSFLWIHGPGPLRLTDLADPHAHLEQLRDHLATDTRWESCRAGTSPI